MTNKEKFMDKMLEAAINRTFFAVDSNGNLAVCSSIRCQDCKFYNETNGNTINCVGDFKKWLDAEYKEPKIDPRLHDAPVDAKILVSDDGINWGKRYFCKIERDRVFAFSDGKTSFSCEGEDEITGWSYGKLWEEDHD